MHILLSCRVYVLNPPQNEAQRENTGMNQVLNESVDSMIQMTRSFVVTT